MPKLSDYEKQKAAAERRIARQREKQSSPEYKAKQLAKQREYAQRQLEKQQAKLADPEYRQQQWDKAKEQASVKSHTPRAAATEKNAQAQKRAEQRQKQLAQRERQQLKQRQRQLEKQQDPAFQEQLRDKAKRQQAARRAKPRTAIKNQGLKGRARTAEEKRLESLLARIGCICCKNQGWYTEAMNSQEGQHYISMHHVDGRTKPWSHAKQLPLCQYHHDTPPPAEAPEELFPLHGTGRKLWEKVNGSQESLLQQVYEMVGEPRPWLMPCEDALETD